MAKTYYYAQTSETRSVIAKAKRKIERMIKENPSFDWKQRNVVIQEFTEEYKKDIMFQEFIFSESVRKWYNKKYR